ncbi:SdpI family protein [Sporolactobacillus sp. THM7-7]|nr:SdpI family protein [Sporolactobacillus sp. THM7-7]
MRKHLIPVIVFAAALGLWIGFYPKMPDQVPIHWGPDGQVDGYASRLQAMISTMVPMIVIYVLTLALPKMDPKRRNYKYFSKSYDYIQIALLLFFLAINAMVVFSGVGYSLPTVHFVQILIGFLFIFLGNYLQSVKQNYFLGIRTPWTLSNETVWKKTHRVGSRLFIIAGILLIVSGFLQGFWPIVILIAIIVCLLVFSFAYSYWLYRKLSDQDK